MNIIYFIMITLLFNCSYPPSGSKTYTSEDGLFNYEVPDGFILIDIGEDESDFATPGYKMAYKTSPTGIYPSIIINAGIVDREAILEGSFIYYQRDLISNHTGNNVSIEKIESVKSDNHPDFLNVVFLNIGDKEFYNSIFYFTYYYSEEEYVLWTMTCTYSRLEKHYENIFRQTAKSFKFNN